MIEETYQIYLFIFFISLIITVLFTLQLINLLFDKQIVGKDMNKIEQPYLPEMGGLGVIIGFVFGFLSILFFNFMGYSGVLITDYLLASIIVIILISLVGIYDDLYDMRQRNKALLPFILAIPLGFFVPSEMKVPFLGLIDFGYTMFFFVPLGVTCASNSANMLEGFNGLGTGLAAIITGTLIIVSIANDATEGLVILIPLLGSLIAFLYFNYYPAKIFPGDTLMIFSGAAISCAAIVSNLRLEGIFLMSPMIVEFFLKLRGNFKGESFAQSIDKGILIYHGKIESLTHIIMINFVVDEKRLVYYFWIGEIFLAFIVILLSYYSLI